MNWHSDHLRWVRTTRLGILKTALVLVYILSIYQIRLYGEESNLPAIRVMPYPHLKAKIGRDPLPVEHTWKRLQADGITDAAEYVKGIQTEAHLRRTAAYRQQSLVIEWDSAPGARWSLNVEGALQSLSDNQSRFPPRGWKRHYWERKDDRNCSLIYESDDPKISLKAAFQVEREHVNYSLTLRSDADQTYEKMTAHLCFNHCWADGFGRDAVVQMGGQFHRLGQIPNPKRIWIRVATVDEDPIYAKLKREQFRDEGIGGNLLGTRLTGPDAVKIKVPMGGVQGRFIASQRKQGCLATVAINSPDAISFGWSFWPCTDIDLAFGTVKPRTPKKVSGRIYFLNGTIEESLEKIRIATMRK